MRLLIEGGNATVGVEGGRIVPVRGSFDATLRVPNGELRPGLINAHDHLHRNHYGRLGAPPYANAYDWGRDIHARHEDRIAAGRAVARRDALLAGAWKNLVAGVTTVVHHDPWEPAFEDSFPLRVAPVRSAHSLQFERALDVWAAGPGPRAIHLAEGVDELSSDEVHELARRGLIDSDLLAVHVVGPDTEGVRLLRTRGAAVVWCPSSNLFLFGATTPAALLTPGLDVLIGSDSLLTAAGTLLDELRCARRLGLVSDDRLIDAVGSTAARRLGIPTPSVHEGAPADLILLRRPLLEASADDVALVIVDGVLRVVDRELRETASAACAGMRCLTIAGVTRWIRDDAVAPPYIVSFSSSSSPSGRRETRPESSRRTRPW